MDLKKYFNSGSKKRDLSSETSTSGDDPKKIRDGSLDDSNNPDDIFTEGLSSPDCVKILYNCIKNVENQIHGIHSKTEETKMSQIKGEQHLMDLNKTVNFICEKFDEYERDRVEKEKIISELQKNVNDMSATIESLKGCLDRQEQYSRRNCLLIHGLPESKNENTDELVIDTIKEKMGEEIEKNEIDRSHRLGPPKNNGKSRPIIIKFVRYNTRCRIFKNKKKLKAKSIRVTESLTKKQIIEALKKAREDHGFENVWSSEGKILYKDISEGNKIIVYFD